MPISPQPSQEIVSRSLPYGRFGPQLFPPTLHEARLTMQGSLQVLTTVFGMPQKWQRNNFGSVLPRRCSRDTAAPRHVREWTGRGLVPSSFGTSLIGVGLGHLCTRAPDLTVTNSRSTAQPRARTLSADSLNRATIGGLRERSCAIFGGKHPSQPERCNEKRASPCRSERADAFGL
jgi:hypothetical protein